MRSVSWAGRPTWVHLQAVPMLWRHGLQGRTAQELSHVQVQAACFAGVQTSRQRARCGTCDGA